MQPAHNHFRAFLTLFPAFIHTLCAAPYAQPVLPEDKKLPSIN